MTSRIILDDVTELKEPELLGGASPLHSGIASLIETTFRKSCNKHGKPLSDDNVDSCRTPFVPVVGAEVPVGQDVHDVVDGVRGQQLLKCSLDSHLAGDAGHCNVLRCFTGRGTHPLGIGIPVAWPELNSNGCPEPGQVGFTFSDIFSAWTESANQDALLKNDALLLVSLAAMVLTTAVQSVQVSAAA